GSVAGLPDIHQHEFGVFKCRYPQFFLFADCRAVPGFEDAPVDLDPADRWHQVGEALATEFIGSRLTRLEAGAEHPGIRMDSQGVGIALPAAGERAEPAGAIRARERPGTPGRWQAALVRDDPDLGYPGLPGLQIVFAMDDAGAGAHDLDVARFGASLVALVVAVADRTFAHIGDDLHVRMGMRWKAGAGLDGVVVPDAQRAPVDPLRVVVVGEGEVVPGIQPAVVGGAEASKGPAFDHLVLPSSIVR